jgi:hypothetical protein
LLWRDTQTDTQSKMVYPPLLRSGGIMKLSHWTFVIKNINVWFVPSNVYIHAIIINFWWNVNFIYVVFYIPLKNISLIWIRHHYRWGAAKFRPMLGTQGGIFIGPHLLLCISGLIWRTVPFNRLLRLARGCWGPILTWILTGNFIYEEMLKLDSFICFEWSWTF